MSFCVESDVDVGPLATTNKMWLFLVSWCVIFILVLFIINKAI